MLRTSMFLVLLSLVAACGGSGGGGGGGDTAAPAVVICFPPPVSMTDAATVSVRGTATDGTSITKIEVNGVPATTTDGFATWTVSNLPVPIVGANLITVESEDSAGNNNPAAATATITRDPNATTTGAVGGGTAFVVLRDIRMDTPRNRLLVVDSGGAGSGALLAVDLATGNRTLVSRDGLGGGLPVMMVNPTALDLDINGSAAYVTDRDLDLVILINIITGFRSIISDSSAATVSFADPVGLVFDPNLNRIFWTDEDANAVLVAPVATGNANAIFSDNGNLGPSYANSHRMELDFANNRALITENLGAGSILAADLTTGDKTPVASGAVGVGGPVGFSFPIGLVLDVVNNRLVTHLNGSDALVFVNPTNGNRTTISENGAVGVGPLFSGGAVGLDFDNQKLLVYLLDAVTDSVYVIDVDSGDRVILSK